MISAVAAISFSSGVSTNKALKNDVGAEVISAVGEISFGDQYVGEFRIRDRSHEGGKDAEVYGHCPDRGNSIMTFKGGIGERTGFPLWQRLPVTLTFCINSFP